MKNFPGPNVVLIGHFENVRIDYEILGTRGTKFEISYP